MTASQDFIKRFSSRLESSPDYYNIDSALSRPEQYESAKVRMLLVLPTPALTKSVSATVTAINDFFQVKHPDYFMDVAYLPTKSDLKIFDAHNMPYAIGHVTHLDPSHFDVVGFSISVLHEILTVPVMVKSFERCDNPIKLTWSERKIEPFGSQPIIIAGGITSAHSDVCFGELGDGRQAYLDGLTLGIDEGMTLILNKIENYKLQSFQGPISEVLDSFFESPHFYQPQAYKVVYKDNIIIENTKINPKAQDWVTPRYDKDFDPNRLYTARTIIQGTGSNAGATQVQLSEGACVEGTLILTTRGSIPIEQVKVGDVVLTSVGEAPVEQVWDLGEMDTLRFCTNSGRTLEVTPNHPILNYSLLSKDHFSEAREFQVGQFLTSPKLLNPTLVLDKDYYIYGRMFGHKRDRDVPSETSLFFTADNPSDYRDIPHISVTPLKNGKYQVEVPRNLYHFDLSFPLHISSLIWTSTPSQKASFIKGVYDECGQFDYSIRFYLSDRKSALDFSNLTSSFGICGYISGVASSYIFYINKASLENCSFFTSIQGSDEKRPISTSKEDWRIICEAAHRPDLFKRWKLNRVYTSHLKEIHHPYDEDLFFEQISSIQPSKGHCYDLTVSSIHRYNANGFEVHNCTGGKGSCSFCSEGNYTGAYVENPIENVRKAALESKRYCAADSCKPLSFNAVADTMYLRTSPDDLHLYPLNRRVKTVLDNNLHEIKVKKIEPTIKPAVRNYLSTGSLLEVSEDHINMVLTPTIGLHPQKGLMIGDVVPQLNLSNTLPIRCHPDNYNFLLGVWFVCGRRTGKRWNLFSHQSRIRLKGFQHELLNYISPLPLLKRGERLKFKPSLLFSRYIYKMFPSYKDGLNRLHTLDIYELLQFISGVISASFNPLRKSGIQFTIRKSHVRILNLITTCFSQFGLVYKVTSASDLNFKVKLSPESSEKFQKLLPLTPIHFSTPIHEFALIPPKVGVWTYNLLKEISQEKGHNCSKFFSGKASLTRDKFLSKFGQYDIESVNLVKQGYTFSTVLDQESLGLTTCVDRTVPSPHQYIVGSTLTHNCNHYSDFRELLYELKKQYPSVSFINMRMEELAKDYESWEMMSYMGASRLSAPIEGLSDRIRNGIMNKNLSKSSVEFIFNQMIGQPITDLKVGLVWTGYENAADWDEYYELMDKVKLRAREMGKLLPVRLKACLTEEALTPVLGQGLVRQSAFTEGSFTEGIDSSVEIKKVSPQGVSSIVKVTTEDGIELYGTPEHPLLVNFQEPHNPHSYRFFKDLKKGDEVFVKYGTNAFNRSLQEINLETSHTLNEGVAKFLALYALNGRYDIESHIITLTLSKPNQELVVRALNHLNINHSITLNQSDVEIRFNMNLEALHQFGGHPGAKVPDIILTSPKNVQIAYLLTLLSTRTVSGSAQFLQDVKAMLTNLGVKSVINQNLTIEAPLRESLNRPIIGYKSTLIKSVQNHVDAPTYGLTVTEGVYITNGIVSHNTPLVLYPLTPFEFSERKSTLISFKGERYIDDDRFQKNREHQVMLKFNGFIGSTFVEQALVDLGRCLTPWVQKYLVLPMEVCYNTRPVIREECYGEFKKVITNPEVYFAQRDVDNTISPLHRIRPSLEGGILAQARKITSKDNTEEPTGKCLFTYEGCQTKCSHKDMASKPFIKYADVRLVDGHLQGTKPQIIEGCNYCETPEERVTKHLKRPIFKRFSLNDIKKTVFARNLSKVRFIITRNSEYRELNPNNTAYTALAALCNHSDWVLNHYWQIEKHSFDHQTKPELPFAVEGIQVIDAFFRDIDMDEIKKAMALANSWLRGTRFVSASLIPNEEKLQLSDLTVYRFETSLPADLLNVCNSTYKGHVSVLKDISMELIQDKSLIAPTTFQYGGKSVGYFCCPIKYNPYLYLQKVYADRRIPLNALKDTFKVKSILFVRESNISCSCGKSTLISLLNQKTLKCRNCLQKSLILLEKKQMNQGL